MIYTVTFNPSVDYIVGLEKLMPNRVNRTREELIYPGGKGINVSIVLKNLGIDSIALGFLAGDTGVMIQNMLQKEGIFTDFVTIEEGMSRINVKIKENGTTEINGMGPKISTRDRNQLYEKLERLEENDILVLAGSIPESMPDTSYVDIMRFLEKRNVKIVVDATKELLTNVLPLHPFLIKPNDEEIADIFGIIVRDEEDIKKAKEIVRIDKEADAYCDSFKWECQGCKVKEFKDKYRRFGRMICIDVYRYLKEKGEI